MDPSQPIAPPLLAWYHQNRRILPFRENPLPYAVWVSEIMLQQTRVAAALPYYTRFMAQLPSIAALAACEEQALHKLWEGLGYYSRARNLHKAARIVVAQYGGELPGSYKQLLDLPGIGEYTAGAIASVAFGLPQVAVDGNVLRVFSRLLAYEDDVKKTAAKKFLATEVKKHQPADAPGDYNQALMELGALVCVPGRPLCGGCPLAAFCAAKSLGVAGLLPVKAPPKPKTEQAVCVLVVQGAHGVLLHQRPDTGLLASLWEPLLFEGTFTRAQIAKKLGALLPGAVLGAPLLPATHVFTHRVWQMYGWQATCQNLPLPPKTVWATPQQLESQYSVPSAFRAYKKLMKTPLFTKQNTF